jgi:rRNA maturation endonuclease Nob1
MAYFVCGKCQFCFVRRGPVDACPDCGHTYIREAEADEIAEFEENRKEADKLHQPN